MTAPRSRPVDIKIYNVARPSNHEGLPDVSLDQAHAPNKVLAHPDLVRKFAAGETFRPIHMRIGIMGACNMRCHFCNFHSPNEENFYDLFSFRDSIPTDKAIRLMGEFASAGGRANQTRSPVSSRTAASPPASAGP